MTSDIATPLEDEALARVDALARLHAITREQMLARIVRTGLLYEERQARESRVRGNGGAS